MDHPLVRHRLITFWIRSWDAHQEDQSCRKSLKNPNSSKGLQPCKGQTQGHIPRLPGCCLGTVKNRQVYLMAILWETKLHHFMLSPALHLSLPGNSMKFGISWLPSCNGTDFWVCQIVSTSARWKGDSRDIEMVDFQPSKESQVSEALGSAPCLQCVPGVLGYDTLHASRFGNIRIGEGASALL